MSINQYLKLCTAEFHVPGHLTQKDKCGDRVRRDVEKVSSQLVTTSYSLRGTKAASWRKQKIVSWCKDN